MVTAIQALSVIAAALATVATAATIGMAAKDTYTLFESPISATAPPSELFPYNAGLKSWLSPRCIPAAVVGTKPIPTNNWWGNMIAASTDTLVQPVWTNPYALRPPLATAPFGLAVSATHNTSNDITSPHNTNTDNASAHHTSSYHDEAYDTSSYHVCSYNTSAYDTKSYDASSYNAGTYHTKAYDASAHCSSAYNAEAGCCPRRFLR